MHQYYKKNNKEQKNPTKQNTGRFRNSSKKKWKIQYIKPAADTNFFLSFSTCIWDNRNNNYFFCPLTQKVCLLVLIHFYWYWLLVPMGLPCRGRNKLPIQINETHACGLHRCSSITHTQVIRACKALPHFIFWPCLSHSWEKATPQHKVPFRPLLCFVVLVGQRNWSIFKNSIAFASCCGNNKLIEGCAADTVVTLRLLHSLKAQIKLRKHSYFTACVVSGAPWFLAGLVHYL